MWRTSRIGYVQAGNPGVELVRKAATRKPAWLTLLERLPAGLAPNAEPLRPR